MRFTVCIQFIVAAGTCLFIPHVTAQTIDEDRIALIDAHALAAHPAAEVSPEILSAYLTQDARTDTEKARAIFRWIGDRISYDVDAYLDNKLVKEDAADVLNARHSICDGYATLFEKLAKHAGLEVISIKGYAKGYAHPLGHVFDQPNHAWNAVRIDGQWRLIDSTWGAGFVREGKYQKVLSERFFLVPPEQLVFSHFPQEERWQLQSTPHLSKQEFEALPPLEPAFFHIGIAGEQVWKTLKAPDFAGQFVRTFDMPYHLVTVQKAPLVYQLKADRTHEFRIQTGAFEKMSVLHNNQWIEMPRDGNVFAVSVTPTVKGELMVLGKKPGVVNYVAIMAYAVE